MASEICPRIRKLIRGCHFEPRYETVEPSASLHLIVSRSWQVPTELLVNGALTKKVLYVRDVCRTCGATRERETS